MAAGKNLPGLWPPPVCHGKGLRDSATKKSAASPRVDTQLHTGQAIAKWQKPLSPGGGGIRGNVTQGVRGPKQFVYPDSASNFGPIFSISFFS